MTRVEEIHRSIDERNVTIANGVSAETKDRLEQEIQALKQELEGMETQELPVNEAEVVNEPILATVDGLPLEVYTRNGDAAILIRCEVEAVIEGINKAHVVVVGGLNNKLHLAAELELSLRQRNSELERDYQLISDEHAELLSDHTEVTQENAQLILERDQALLYRDNAVKQLEDMAFELEQNRIELNRNREVRALTEAERTAEQEAARQRFLDSRIKIYNPRDASELNSRERIANLAETGEEITYLAIYEKGGYNIITEEEALAIQAMNKPVEIPQIDEVQSEELFQSEESTQDPDESTDSGEQREATEVEPETFEQRTERRLTAIERRLDKDEPEFFHEVA